MPPIESRKRLNALYLRVLRRGVAATLRRNGFRRERGVYLHVGEEVVWAVHPERPPFTASPGKVHFELDCGVLVTAIQKLFPDCVIAYHPASTAGQIRPLIEAISGDARHRFWEIRDDFGERELEALEQQVSTAIECHLLPWFRQFQSAKSVGDYLAQPGDGPGLIRRSYRNIPQDARDLRNAAIAYFGAGEYDRAREMLDLAEATIDRHGKHLTADLRQRIERLIAQRQQARGETKVGESW